MKMYQVEIDKSTEAITLLDHGVTLSKEEMESIVNCWEHYKKDKK